jgi:Domain of unknown function (DUF6894)
MKRYFFDRVGEERLEYDFCGSVLPSPEAAYQIAEMIAIDLEIVEEGAWSGWEISVRDAGGRKFFSVPVRQPLPELAAV